MSRKLAEDFAAFKIAEEGQSARLQDLSCQIKELVGKYDDALRDLESERVARRFTQQEADESRAKYEDLQQSMERSSFALVLIDADADSYIFKDEYYAASDGGRKASLDLSNGVRSFLQAHRPELPDYPILIKAYANEAGLSQFLVSSGIIKAPRDLVDFAKDFTQASEYTDFLLVGSGKDRADKKIQGSLKQFVRNPTCRHIIFGACHDNSYVRLLEDYAHDDSVVDRVTLLHGFSVGREFRDLRFKSFKMEDVFNSAPVRNLAPTPEPLASVSSSSSWASTGGSKADASSRESRAESSVRLNSAGYRIDDYLRKPNKQAVNSWYHKVVKAQMRYCRLYHLSGLCPNSPLLGKKERRPRPRSVQKQDPPGALPTQVPDELDSLGLEHLKLEEPRGPTLRCHFHNGKAADKKWTCCGAHVSGPPCKHEEHHLPEQSTLKEMSSRWQYSVTPASTTKNARKAVVIDCEMGTAASGDSELIRLTLIDYFSRQVLIDNLVWPDVLMSHLNTKYSGVTWQSMREARNAKRCIFGRKNARALVWKFVSPETIVIGHGASSDLTSLRWIHPQIIDTLIVEGNNHDGKTNGLSLKKLAELRLQRIIQKGKGHDSLEDAIATRDLLHCNVVRLVEGKTEG
ncbi:rna exonuclease 3 [Fusarium flagelliforme]|uniref:Rna exonuclease 3 n=1 Tax=Fusarium flagelliforme TaxID=2675880 RepID=A0A395M6M8_9HYPO|nr:rna exonuclease 3 [Fusarium flagelliforme]